MSRHKKGQGAPKRRGNDRQWHVSPEDKPPARERFHLPPRIKPPPLPTTTLEPTPGRWVWTCRAGFEGHLYEELAGLKLAPRLLGEALVESTRPVNKRPAFGRQCFPADDLVSSPAAAQRALGREPGKLQVWSVDTDAGHRLSVTVSAWSDTIAGLRAEQGIVDLDTPWKAFEAGADLLQVLVLSPARAWVGRLPARDAVSLATGGVSRMKRTAAAPSRAAMKLDEALDWHGVAPGKGEVCVDLGSAPGGWTRRLLERGAKVWSVDTGQLAPDLAKHPRVKHFTQSAFSFAPDESVDWLFCDMAWRPLEVAQLLGKWVRNKWALQVVANLKLPMKDKLPTLLHARWILEDAGWKDLRVRQLYHDRDEVTLTARRGA